MNSIPPTMPTQGTKKVVAVLSDLFFQVKISDAAKRAGLDVAVAGSEDQAFERAKEHPMLMIIDLNCEVVHPLKLIQRIKSSEALRGINLIGFVSHVQGDLKAKAQEAGCDMVMARSAFSQNLPQILKRHASAA